MEKEKMIETPELTIKGNVIQLPDMLIQLSNVSSISMSNLALKPTPIVPLLLILAAVLFFTVNREVSIIMMIIGGCWIIIWLLENLERSKARNLNIILNSGTILCIQIKDIEFLKKVFNVLKKILIHGGIEKGVYINIKNSTIKGEVLNDAKINL